MRIRTEVQGGEALTQRCRADHLAVCPASEANGLAGHLHKQDLSK